jgi:Fe-S cluster biogenesis protein NfuA
MNIFTPVTKETQPSKPATVTKIGRCDTCGLVDHSLYKGACESCNEKIKEVRQDIYQD